MIISFIKGKALDNSHESFDDVVMWKNVAKDISLLQNIQCSHFGKIEQYNSHTGIFRGSLDSWRDFFSEVSAQILSDKITKLLTSREVKLLSDYWKENKERISLDNGFLVHGDFCMDHIWVNNGKYSGLIDFGDAFIGDPLMDFAYFKLKEINKDYGDKTFNTLYSLYFGIVQDNRAEEDKKILINLYMIYWAISRIVGALDEETEKKFGKKLKVLLKQL